MLCLVIESEDYDVFVTSTIVHDVSLVPRPSRGGERKAWYTLHAHAPLFSRFWRIRIRLDIVGILTS